MDKGAINAMACSGSELEEGETKGELKGDAKRQQVRQSAAQPL
jgi:hypothetical protein